MFRSNGVHYLNCGSHQNLTLTQGVLRVPATEITQSLPPVVIVFHPPRNIPAVVLSAVSVLSSLLKGSFQGLRPIRSASKRMGNPAAGRTCRHGRGRQQRCSQSTPPFPSFSSHRPPPSCAPAPAIGVAAPRLHATVPPPDRRCPPADHWPPARRSASATSQVSQIDLFFFQIDLSFSPTRWLSSIT